MPTLPLAQFGEAERKRLHRRVIRRLAWKHFRDWMVVYTVACCGLGLVVGLVVGLVA